MRISKFLSLTSLALVSCQVLAEPTPMDQKLPAGQETMIECDVVGKAETFDVYTNLNNENPAESKKLTGYHYKLYIPEDYHTAKDKVYPVMFIASPGGGASMGQMRDRLTKDGWIVASLQESKNDSFDWLNNFCAAYDDVTKRCRTAKGLKFATGMSGGARCSSVFAVTRPGFSGIILQAAGFAYGFKKIKTHDLYDKYPEHIAVAGTFGTKDMNLYETQEIRCSLNKKSSRYAEVFEGGHAWCPTETFDHVMDWMEQQVFLSPPKKTKDCRLLTRNGKAEPMDKNSYLWFHSVLLKRLDAAESKAEKYQIASKLAQLIKCGRIQREPQVADSMAKCQSVYRQLKSDPDLRNEFNARSSYKNLEKLYDAFALQRQKSTAKFKKIELSKREERALEKYLEAVDAFVEKHGDTTYGKRAKIQADSMRLEYGK